MVLAGPIAAWIFNEKALEPIIMSLSIVIFAQAVSTIPGAALQQSHRFKTIAMIELSSLFIGIAMAILFALSGAGAWALAIQQIVFYTLRCILTFCYSPFRALRVFDLRIVREHLIFGRNVIGVAMIHLGSKSADNLIIGKILGSASLGIYSMAFQFARLPIMLITGPLQYVLYAQLAQLKTNVKMIAQTYLLLNRVLAILIFPVMGMVAVAHEPIFKWLLSQKWALSGEVFMLVAAACTLQTITSLSGTIMMVLGRTDRQLRMTAEFNALWISLLLVTVWKGLEVAAFTYNVAVFIYFPRLLSILLPLIQCLAISYIRTFFVPILCSIGCILLYNVLNHEFEFGQYTQIGLSGLLAMVGITMGTLIQRRTLRTEVALCRQALNA